MSTLKEDFDALKRLHLSANEANEKLQEENRELRDENILLLKKLLDCQNALDINKEIMRNALTIQNEMKDAYTQEINKLRALIKTQG